MAAPFTYISASYLHLYRQTYSTMPPCVALLHFAEHIHQSCHYITLSTWAFAVTFPCLQKNCPGGQRDYMNCFQKMTLRYFHYYFTACTTVMLPLNYNDSSLSSRALQLCINQRKGPQHAVGEHRFHIPAETREQQFLSHRTLER